MNLYKSHFLDGCHVVSGTKQNCTGLCLKLFGTKCTHSCIPGLKGEFFLSDFEVIFVLSADRRLVRIHISLLAKSCAVLVALWYLTHIVIFPSIQISSARNYVCSLYQASKIAWQLV
jgi:hypothetical protein